MIARTKPRRFLFLGLGILSLVVTLSGTPAKATFQPTTPTPIVSTPANAANGLEQGRKLYQVGRFNEAIAAWTLAAEQYRTQNDRLNQALALSYLSSAQQELSQWDAARQSIDQSLELLETSKADAIFWAQALNTKASLLLQAGKGEEALELWQQAQKNYEKASDTLGSMGSQINQAQALQSLGYYRRARQQLESLNIQLSGMTDSEIKVSALRSLGSALQMIGDTERGLAVLEEALTVAKEVKATNETSAILLSLGRTEANLGEPEKALTYFEQAEKAAVNPLDQIQARLDQMKLFVDYDLLDRAVPLAPQLLQQLQGTSASRASLYNSIHFVATLNKLENPGELVSIKDLGQLMSSTVKAAQQIKDAQAEAHALNQWGQLYGRTEQWAEAQQLMQRSLTIARQLHADDIISQSAWKLGKLAKVQGRRNEAIASYTEAVKSLKSLRGDLVAVNPDVQFSFRESVEPVYRELVGLLLDDNPNQESLLQARELIEALQVAELDNFFREACLDKARQIDQVDPTATVIYPIILPDRVAVVQSTAGQPLRYHSTKISKEEVEKSLSDLSAALNPVSDYQDRIRLSQQVYDWLIRPAEADLKNTKTLVFVLDGKFRNLPMSALYDGKQFLIEKYAVTLSPGLQLMASQALNQSNLGAIVGGISESRSGFSALPAVEAEVKQISKTIASSSLLNNAFTNNALADRIKNSNANVVHLATHGQFSSRLEDTFLLTWDGRVNVKELSELLQSREGNTSKIDLLVLSACDTATGDDRAVLGLAGLAVKSGARSTVATLWPVKDQAASSLMTRFYQQLRTPGATKAEALRQAQIEMIQQTDFKEPFFWSAFVLVGNWQ
jgi:CHAT domain-containing protein